MSLLKSVLDFLVFAFKYLFRFSSKYFFNKVFVTSNFFSVDGIFPLDSLGIFISIPVVLSRPNNSAVFLMSLSSNFTPTLFPLYGFSPKAKVKK